MSLTEALEAAAENMDATDAVAPDWDDDAELPALFETLPDLLEDHPAVRAAAVAVLAAARDRAHEDAEEYGDDLDARWAPAPDDILDELAADPAQWLAGHVTADEGTTAAMFCAYDPESLGFLVVASPDGSQIALLPARA